MTRLRVLTVDDEPLALRRLQLLLKSFVFIDHVGEANSCQNAIEATASLAPDVVLLDIKMRDGDGFLVIERLAAESHSPIVIFVTAFDQFAVRAFDAGVIDYLLKPVEGDRLERALARARLHLERTDAAQRNVDLQNIVRRLRSVATENDGAFEREFWIRNGAGVVRVPVESITSVSSEDDYVAIHTIQGSHLVRGSIKQFERRVEPGQFVRVHRTWLVRKSEILEIRTQRMGGAQVRLRSGENVPVGRVHLKSLRQQI